MNVHSCIGIPVNQPDRIPPQPDQRAVEILEGVRLAFAEKGFDGASMQDLARACGMSVGNFYRYFPSKAAIVAALVTRDLAEVESGFRFIIESPDPMAALRAELRNRIVEDQCQSDGQLWAEMAAASMRKPEIAEITQQMEAEICVYLLTVFAQVLGIDLQVSRQRFGAHARMLVMMIKASAMNPSRDPAEREQLTELTIRTVNRILDEVVEADVKG